MASTGYLSNCGWYLTVLLDPEAGGVIDGPVTYLAGLEQCTLSASGGAVSVTRIACRKKYPFGVGGRFKARFKLSRPIHVGETGITFTPAAAMFHDGTTFNSTTPAAIENRSYYHDSIAELVANTNPNAPIYFVDPVNGDNALASAANGGLGYWQLSDYADPEGESNGPQAYQTYEGAFEHARGTTNEFTPRGISAVILIRGGTTIDGETETSAASGLFAATGGAALNQPFVVGSYDHASGQAVCRARSTTGGKWTRVLNIAGSASYCVLSRNIRVEGTALHRSAARFLSDSGSPTREDYLCLGVEFNSCFLQFSSTHTGFVQNRASFVECVFDGNNVTSGNGGAVQGVESWDEFSWRETVFKDCVVCRHGDGDQWHAFYLKTHIDPIINDNWIYECSGTGTKMDSCHGYDVRGNNLVRCNSVGNNESNGHSGAGYPANRSKVIQTAEQPAGGFAGGLGVGGYGNWGTMCDNTLSDTLGQGERGSAANALCYSMGQSQDCELRNNLALFSGDNIVVGIGVPSNGGSVNGFFKDAHDCEAAENTLAYIAGGTRQVRLLSVSPAQSDTFNASDNDQHGLHGCVFERNIFAIVNASGGDTSLVRHGTGSPTDFRYSESQAAGRADYRVDYNCFWAESLNNAFRNGDEAEVFSTLAAWEADMNSGADTPCTGNRVENPNFTNAGYQFSDYLLGLGHATLDDAFDAIIAATLAGTMQGGVYATQTAADAVRERYATSLNRANYNNMQIGIEGEQLAPANILIDQAPDDGTINLGNIAQGSASSVSLTIRNNAPLPASDLTLGVLSVSAGGALTANPSGSVIAAGSSVVAAIAIDTVTEGARAVLVQVPSDDPDNPSYDITINATVVGAELQVTLDDAPLGNGAAIEFTGLVESTHATITLDLTNAGMADLTLGTILTGGRLTTTVNGDPSGEVLGPLDTVSLELVIDTSVVGAVAGSLSIPSNDADSPWVATASGVVAASNAPSDDYTGPSTRQEYLNVAEVGAILAEIIVVSGMLRQAWESLSTDDKIACIANASIDFDSIRWKGHKLDADQPTAWPRKDRYGNLILPQGEVQYPASLGDGAWSFASLPREIRIGIAVQAAARAADQLNLDQSLQVVGMAAQGITGIGGAGTAWSTEGHIARQPSAQLHRVVRQLVSRYLATSAEFV